MNTAYRHRLIHYVRPLANACLGPRVHLAGMQIEVPGTLPIRLSVVAGNIRMHRSACTA
jgi:hypothetical protein